MNASISELSVTLALGQIGWTQMIVLGLLGVLIFGKRLPEVGKSLGKGIVEFKKGLSGIDTDLDDNAGGTGGKQLDSTPAASSPAAAPTATPTAAEPHAAEVHAETKAE